MSTIQSLLILSFVALSGYALIRFQNAALERLAVLACSACAVVFVFFPMWATKVANFVGVGRGADLLIYLLTIFVFFFFLLTYIRFLRQDRDFTKLVRLVAIQMASRPADRKAAAPDPGEAPPPA